MQAPTKEVRVEQEVPHEVDEGMYLYVCLPDHCSPSLCLLIIASLTFDIISLYIY